jgi:ribosomal protein S17
MCHSKKLVAHNKHSESCKGDSVTIIWLIPWLIPGVLKL